MHIEPERFLKQPQFIQQTFLNWWEPKMYDLFFRNFTNENGFLKGVYKGCIEDNEVLRNATKDKSFLPVLSLNQLIEFIFDNNYLIDVETFEGFQVTLKIRKELGEQMIIRRIKSNDFFDLIWSMALYVALEISKEEIKEE